MNSQLFEQARAAYRAGDYSAAAQMFSAAKDATEISGELDHLRGNSLMHLGMFRDAAAAYAAALNDPAYGKVGALLTNEGKALFAAGDVDGAIKAFSSATQDSTYATPYKAYLGLGKALLSAQKVSEAGTAFRMAAIDGANPAPSAALSQLGECFVKLGRPQDAVESYRTALDFATPRDDTRAINAGLGQALAASGRALDAREAFQRATADGIYQLTSEQADDLARVQDQLDAAAAQTAISAAVDTAPAMPAQPEVDPLDPMGKSGQFMPDPSDTGFFSLTEAEMVQQDRAQAKVRRHHRHVGLKVFIAILVVLLIGGGALGFCYTRGLGFPSQETVLTDLFNAVTDGETDKAESYLASSLTEQQKSLIVSSIPADSTPTIEGLDKSMTESTAKVSVALSKGGTQEYEVKFVRSDNRIGWSVSSIDIDLGSTGSDSSN